jgi:hypothetical protein
MQGILDILLTFEYFQEAIIQIHNQLIHTNIEVQSVEDFKQCVIFLLNIDITKDDDEHVISWWKVQQTLTIVKKAGA